MQKKNIKHILIGLSGICAVVLTIPFISMNASIDLFNKKELAQRFFETNSYRRQVGTNTAPAIGDDVILKTDPFDFVQKKPDFDPINGDKPAIVNYSPEQYSTQSLSLNHLGHFTDVPSNIISSSILNKGLYHGATAAEKAAIKDTWSLASYGGAPALWRWDSFSSFGMTKMTQGYSQNPVFVFGAMNKQGFGLGGNTTNPKTDLPNSAFQVKNYEMLDLNWKDVNPAKDLGYTTVAEKEQSDIMSYVEKLNNLFKFVNRSNNSGSINNELIDIYGQTVGVNYKQYDSDGFLKSMTFDRSWKNYNGWNYLSPELNGETNNLFNGLISIKTENSSNTSFNNQTDLTGDKAIILNLEVNPLFIYAMANLSNAHQFYLNNLNLPLFIKGINNQKNTFFEIVREPIVTNGIETDNKYYIQKVSEKSVGASDYSPAITLDYDTQVYNRNPLSDFNIINIDPNILSQSDIDTKLTEIVSPTTAFVEVDGFDWGKEFLKQIPIVQTKVKNPITGEKEIDFFANKLENSFYMQTPTDRMSNFFLNAGDMFEFPNNYGGYYVPNSPAYDQKKIEHNKSKKKSLEMVAPNNKNLLSPLESPFLYKDQSVLNRIHSVRDIILSGAVVSKSEVNNLSSLFGEKPDGKIDGKKTYNDIGKWNETKVYNPFTQENLLPEGENVFAIKIVTPGQGANEYLKPSLWWNIAKQYKLSIDTFERLMNINSKMLINLDIGRVEATTLTAATKDNNFDFIGRNSNIPRKRMSISFGDFIERWSYSTTRERAAFKVSMSNPDDIADGGRNDEYLLKKNQNSILQSITTLGQGLFISNPFVVNGSKNNQPILWKSTSGASEINKGLSEYNTTTTADSWKIKLPSSQFLQSPTTTEVSSEAVKQESSNIKNPNFGFGHKDNKTIFITDVKGVPIDKSPWVLNTPFALSNLGEFRNNVIDVGNTAGGGIPVNETFEILNYINYVYKGQYKVFTGVNNGIVDFLPNSMEYLQNNTNEDVTNMTNLTTYSGVPMNEVYTKAVNLKIETFSNTNFAETKGWKVEDAITSANESIQSSLLTDPFSTNKGSYRNYWSRNKSANAGIFQKTEAPFSWSTNNQMWFWFTKGFRIENNIVTNSPNWFDLNNDNKNINTISTKVLRKIQDARLDSKEEQKLISQVIKTMNTLPSSIIRTDKANGTLNELWRNMFYDNEIKIDDKGNDDKINELLKGYFYTINKDTYLENVTQKPTLKDFGLTNKHIAFSGRNNNVRSNRWGEFNESEFTGNLNLKTEFGNLQILQDGITNSGVLSDLYPMLGFAKRLWFDLKNGNVVDTMAMKNYDEEDHDFFSNNTPEQIVLHARDRLLQTSLLVNKNDANLSLDPNNNGVSTNLNSAFLKSILNQQINGTAFNAPATETISTTKRYGAALLMEAKGTNTLKVRLVLKNEDRIKIPVGGTLSFGGDFFIEDSEIKNDKPDVTKEELEEDTFNEYNFEILNVGYNKMVPDGSVGGDGSTEERPEIVDNVEALKGKLAISQLGTNRNWDEIKVALNKKEYDVLNTIFSITNERKVVIQPSLRLWTEIIEKINFNKELTQPDNLIFSVGLNLFLETGSNVSFNTIEVYESQVVVKNLQDVKSDLLVWTTEDIVLLVCMSILLVGALTVGGLSIKKLRNKAIIKK